MPTRVRDVFFRELAGGLYEPTAKRIRVVLGDQTVVDTTRAVLVWEPRRVVPSYAVPAEDLVAEVLPLSGPADAGVAAVDGVSLGDRKVLDPSIPFQVHTLDGEELTVRAGPATAGGAAFRPSDPELAGYVILDFDAFDAWYEEDERLLSHPRDPFHRIDILHSSRHVRVERDGQVLAESSQPYLLFETNLPVRFYLPPEDVRMETLEPSSTRSYCAYKGEASYWSLVGEARGVPDVAWTYRQPLREATELTGRIAFFNERVDIVVDGEPLPRPRTPWSRG